MVLNGTVPVTKSRDIHNHPPTSSSGSPVKNAGDLFVPGSQSRVCTDATGGTCGGAC